MKKHIKFVKSIALILPLMAISLSVLLFTNPVAAVECYCGTDDQVMTAECGSICAKTPEQPEDLFGTDGVFTKIINTALFLVGAISVGMLIYGGIRYTVSGGDSTAVSNAKNTILYAIVGVVISLLAYSIVNFVIGRLV